MPKTFMIIGTVFLIITAVRSPQFDDGVSLCLAFFASIIMIIYGAGVYIDTTNWNDGVCRQCNTRWRRKYTTSDQIYMCGCKEHHDCMITHCGIIKIPKRYK